MTDLWARRWDRRSFLATGLALAASPWEAVFGSRRGSATETDPEAAIRAVVREETLFAGIRKPIRERQELGPRIERLRTLLGDRIAGPLTHVFRFDTPVEGFDSEIGFPVTTAIDDGEVATHTLRSLCFYAKAHRGPVATLRETARELYATMNSTGLSPELELVEVYERYDPEHPEVEVWASFLAWPEIYRQQLSRVLGEERAGVIWQGGEAMTPFTRVDPRCLWVAATLDRLKNETTPEQQFDILSRVALRRPPEDVAQYKKLYDQSRDVAAVLRAQQEQLRKTRTGGFVDPPRFDGKVLHLSKVPYDGAAYAAARSHREKRKAFCFCNLVREAEEPRIDPIFCYRAAGWARQLWEPILETRFRQCRITHSILAGDDFCAWDYILA